MNVEKNSSGVAFHCEPDSSYAAPDSPCDVVELALLSGEESVEQPANRTKAEHEISLIRTQDISFNTASSSAATLPHTLDRFYSNKSNQSGELPDLKRVSSSLFRSSFFRRKNKPAESKIQDEAARPFLRAESIINRAAPCNYFTPYAPMLILPDDKCDPKLGTLGELRHLMNTGSTNQVKKFIRRNFWPPGQRIRAALWKELCLDISSAEAQISAYKEFLEKLDKSPQATRNSLPVVMSSLHAIVNNFMLNEDGVKRLLRILTAIEHLKPDFSYIPTLYPLGALFLHYMSHENAFVSLMRLLSHSQEFLLQTDIAIVASNFTLLLLIKKHMRGAYSFLQRILHSDDDKKIVPVFDGWMRWIFNGLPFTHLVKIVDCFLYEGHKVFYRITMVVVDMWQKEKRHHLKELKDKTCADLSASILEYCKTASIPPPKLLKMAFSIRNLKMSYIRRLQEKHELDMRRGDSNLAESLSSHNVKSLLAAHHYLDSALPSEILTKQQGSEIIKHLPTRFQMSSFCCLFSTNVDGTSFNRLWSKIDDFEPTIIVIRTYSMEIFGAFCSESWSKRRTTHKLCNFGTGETFLFTFTPTLHIYRWIGLKKSKVEHREELFQTADALSLIIGGSAISIRNSLETGSSEFSYTFDSPALSTCADFDIEVLEVLGLAVDAS